ncbi:hypothetical protein [Romboutsia ilealis]|uniref:hypothetical protein n=1 Tax=Romboutsia ilealis TaxID=1115758 RepID=UPI0027298C2E|nr:hypothetical protein [Romboutsia ilealis]
MEILPGIDVRKSKRNPTIDSEESLYELPFYKDADYFFNIDNYIFFIKAVEKLVRSSNYYSRYIAHLKKDLGLNFCQVKSNIQESEEDKHDKLIEMHHGPILTLFDCVAIVLEYLLYKQEKITTFSVANIIIEEHFNYNIQTVMLCKTVHEQVHENNVFLNMKQGFGNLNRFLEKYKEGVQPEQIYKINKYIELSHQYDSFDKDVLKLNKNVTEWSKELGIDNEE